LAVSEVVEDVDELELSEVAVPESALEPAVFDEVDPAPSEDVSPPLDAPDSDELDSLDDVEPLDVPALA